MVPLPPVGYLVFYRVTYFAVQAVFSRVKTALGGGGRVVFDWRTESGRTMEAAARVACHDRSFCRLQRFFSFYFIRSSLVSESQVTFISLPYDYCSTASTLRAKSDGVVAIVLLRARPQSGSAALVIRIGVGVRAVALCGGESLNKHIRGEICCKTTH